LIKHQDILRFDKFQWQYLVRQASEQIYRKTVQYGNNYDESQDTHPEVSPVPPLYRKHPVSIAVSMALLAVAAVSARAAEGTSAPADDANTQSQAPAPSESTTAPSPDGKNPENLETIVVTGVRASQIRAIDIKRQAQSIQDSISAESIGQLPDTTISDALQRITGVQINRDGGIGTSVDVRGLPQVGTMLNGEVFITPDQIDSQQPDFTTLPATMFNQVDVIKSPTASQTASGISGALDLHTFRPWDLPHGFTYSYSADGERGSSAKKDGPEANGLISFNSGGWGLLVSGDYSDTTRMNATEGLDQYGVVLNSERAASAGAYNGFLGAWNGATVPGQIKQYPNGDVNVKGFGGPNGVFMGSQDISLYDTLTERKRKSFNSAFQIDLGRGVTMTSDYFYAHQDQWDRNMGIQFNSTNWQGATYVPLQFRNTGSTVLGQYNTPPADPNWAGTQIYTTQVYEKWPGDVESFTQVTRQNSTSRNLNLQFDYDGGGPFKGSVRGIHESASKLWLETDTNISNSDGCLWQDASTGLPCGTFVYPAQLGGNRVFNPNGIPQNSQPMIANFTGPSLAIGMSAPLAASLANPDGWRMKTLESSDDYDRSTTINVLRLDGHYDLKPGLNFDFGLRDGVRSADNLGFTLVTPVYGGMGASNPGGCLVRYVGADVILNGNGGSWCTAGNATGSFRAGPLSALPISQEPASLSGNWQRVTNLLGSGVNFWAINPNAINDPMAFWKSLYPLTTTQLQPATTWTVRIKELASYAQANQTGHIGDMSFSSNIGARLIHTDLDVTQDLAGAPGEYGTEAALAGYNATHRSYNDILPAANFKLNLNEKLTLRLAASKNMMPLDLSQWGGGLSLNYSLLETKQGPIYQVSQGQSTGNPSLDPWRSTNFGASLDYYIDRTSLISFEIYRINVENSIVNGATTNCTLPDEDGVVRHHCITITQPIQESGSSIQGAEFDVRRGFEFLPGLLSKTGMEFNVTYAPSHTGQTDLAGKDIPFQDNSVVSGNLVLWYQDDHFQARLAENYRSRRAVMNSVGGVQGLEEYEAPQHYVDASIAYKFDKTCEVFLNASNLTNEAQRFYLVWPDQPGHTQFSERMFMLGMRGQW